MEKSIKESILDGDITPEELKEYILFVVCWFIVSGSDNIEEIVNEFFKQYKDRFIISVKMNKDFSKTEIFQASVIPVYCMN